MNTLILRGLAVLASLCLVTRVSALTVTHNFQASSSAVDLLPGTLSTYTLVQLPQFDQTLGALVSVTIDIHATGRAIGTDHNPYDEPWPSGGFVTVFSRFTVAGFQGLSPETSYVRGPNDPANIPPHGTLLYVLDYDIQHSHSVTDELNKFTGNGNLAMAIGATMRSGTDGVGSSLTQNVSAVVTYNYRIPDGGSTMAMSLPIFFMLLGHRYRRALTIAAAPRGA